MRGSGGGYQAYGGPGFMTGVVGRGKGDADMMIMQQQRHQLQVHQMQQLQRQQIQHVQQLQHAQQQQQLQHNHQLQHAQQQMQMQQQQQFYSSGDVMQQQSGASGARPMSGDHMYSPHPAGSGVMKNMSGGAGVCMESGGAMGRSIKMEAGAKPVFASFARGCLSFMPFHDIARRESKIFGILRVQLLIVDI